jgi:hypothetical protein
VLRGGIRRDDVRNGKSRGLDLTCATSGGSRLLVSGLAIGQERASKKPGAPSGPRLLVRPVGGPAASGLARDGHRSPDAVGAGRRKASVEEERLRHHSEPPPVAWVCARDMRAGRESTRLVESMSTRDVATRRRRPPAAAARRTRDSAHARLGARATRRTRDWEHSRLRRTRDSAHSRLRRTRDWESTAASVQRPRPLPRTHSRPAVDSSVGAAPRAAAAHAFATGSRGPCVTVPPCLRQSPRVDCQSLEHARTAGNAAPHNLATQIEATGRVV